MKYYLEGCLILKNGKISYSLWYTWFIYRKKGMSAEQRLFNSGVDKIITTDSLIDDNSLDKRVEVLGSGCLIGEAIIRTAYGIPVSPLFI